MTEQEMIERIKDLEAANEALLTICKKMIKMLSSSQAGKILPEVLDIYAKYGVLK